MKRQILLAALSLSAWACSDTKFSAASARKADDTTASPSCAATDTVCLAKPGATCVGAGCPASTPTSSSDTPTAGNNACVQGDKVNFAWSGPEQDCIIGQGKTYNFDTKQCAAMKPSQFDCTWDNVKAELSKRGLLTETLKNDSDAGAKLVTCGESQDTNRIVVQWVKVADATPNAACSYDVGSHHITTGCYTVYANGQSPPPTPASDAERSAQVFACMNQL